VQHCHCIDKQNTTHEQLEQSKHIQLTPAEKLKQRHESATANTHHPKPQLKIFFQFFDFFFPGDAAASGLDSGSRFLGTSLDWPLAFAGASLDEDLDIFFASRFFLEASFFAAASLSSCFACAGYFLRQAAMSFNTTV
jgi:hypothetical protein